MASFWKVFFGVLAALIVAGSCVVGGCVLLIGGAATTVAKGSMEGKQYVNQMEVGDLKWERRGGGDFITIRGRVTNRGPKTVRYWKLALRYLDTKGAVVDTGMTNSGNRLGPGESEMFDTMQRYHPSIWRINAQVEEVSLAP